LVHLDGGTEKFALVIQQTALAFQPPLHAEL
jgi:hypothetical protein